MPESALQLTLDLPELTDPLTCQHRQYVESIDRTICRKDGRITYTTCHRGLCGEKPHCVWDEPDNSPEAMARRLEWMRTHKEEP